MQEKVPNDKVLPLRPGLSLQAEMGRMDLACLAA